MPVSPRTRDALDALADPRDERVAWFRRTVQRLADEMGEPWLLLDGLTCPVGQNWPSSMGFMHAAPRRDASRLELEQAVEVIRPR